MALTVLEKTYIFRVGFLGASALKQTSTGLGSIQKPLRELYFKYLHSPKKISLLPTMQIKLTSNGIAITRITKDGAKPQEAFYDVTSIVMWDAVRFVTVRGDRKKLRCAFEPLDNDHSRNKENLFGALDKKFAFLNDLEHLPILVCVLRRTQGIKRLEFHAFMCSNDDEAMDIVKSINAMQSRFHSNESKGSGIFSYNPFAVVSNYPNVRPNNNTPPTPSSELIIRRNPSASSFADDSGDERSHLSARALPDNSQGKPGKSGTSPQKGYEFKQSDFRPPTRSIFTSKKKKTEAVERGSDSQLSAPTNNPYQHSLPLHASFEHGFPDESSPRSTKPKRQNSERASDLAGTSSRLSGSRGLQYPPHYGQNEYIGGDETQSDLSNVLFRKQPERPQSRKQKEKSDNFYGVQAIQMSQTCGALIQEETPELLGGTSRVYPLQDIVARPTNAPSPLSRRPDEAEERRYPQRPDRNSMVFRNMTKSMMSLSSGEMFSELSSTDRSTTNNFSSPPEQLSVTSRQRLNDFNTSGDLYGTQQQQMFAFNRELSGRSSVSRPIAKVLPHKMGIKVLPTDGDPQSQASIYGIAPQPQPHHRTPTEALEIKSLAAKPSPESAGPFQSSTRNLSENSEDRAGQTTQPSNGGGWWKNKRIVGSREDELYGRPPTPPAKPPKSSEDVGLFSSSIAAPIERDAAQAAVDRNLSRRSRGNYEEHKYHVERSLAQEALLARGSPSVMKQQQRRTTEDPTPRLGADRESPLPTQETTPPSTLSSQAPASRPKSWLFDTPTPTVRNPPVALVNPAVGKKSVRNYTDSRFDVAPDRPALLLGEPVAAPISNNRPQSPLGAGHQSSQSPTRGVPRPSSPQSAGVTRPASPIRRPRNNQMDYKFKPADDVNRSASPEPVNATMPVKEAEIASVLQNLKYSLNSPSTSYNTNFEQALGYFP